MAKSQKIRNELNTNIQLFVDNWKDLKRKLECYGYIPSNIQTFGYAKKMMEKGRNVILPNDKNIDPIGLGDMMETINSNDLVYVAFAYPLLDDFNVFYYKKQDSTILNIVSEYYKVGNQARIETLNNMLEVLNVAKMNVVLDEDKYDLIDDEIELMETIQDFGTSSELIINDIQFILNGEINKINDSLKIVKKRMVASDYFSFKAKKINEVREITESVIRNVRFLISVHEN